MSSDNIKAGVVVKTRFVNKAISKDKNLIQTFKGYIDYIDRSEAVRSDYFSRYNLSSQYEYYNDYMSNPEKSGGLFTAKYDTLSAENISELKNAFQKGYDNNSIMWQTVVSFDNRFLAQLGIYNPITGLLDESLLQQATRRMMDDVFKNEHISHTAVWSAAIHYNTDNIHIHIAYTEPVPSRRLIDYEGELQFKGALSAKTLRSMKSKMVNTLLENEYTILDDYIRNKFVKNKGARHSLEDKELRDMWFRIYDNLPADKRLWFYNMNGIKNIRPLLDELTTKYLTNKENISRFTSFQKELIKQQNIFKTAYGENSKYINYFENKMQDLYARMGNAILKEMRQYHSLGLAENFQNNKHIRYSQTSMILGKLKRSLHQAFASDEYKNNLEYEKLQQAILYN